MLSLRNTPAITINAVQFALKCWRDPRNKDLMKLAIEHRLNLAPCTIFQLDQLGQNHIEIIQMGNCVGMLNVRLPTADCEFLDLMQEKFGIVFNYEEKLKKVMRYRINCFCSDFIVDQKDPGGPMRALRMVSLINLDALK